MVLLRRTATSMILIAAVSLAARLVTLPVVGEGKITPDGARFLNLARSIERGEGYVIPEAWPAWLKPDSLPAPETFKEPGYPYAIAVLTPLTGNPFRAGQLVSLLTGLALPFLTYALIRKLEQDRAVATMAGVFAAASPILILQSVYLMADSLFAFTLTLAFVLSLWGQGDKPDQRRVIFALVCGASFGLAFLVRAQAVLALPALVWALSARRLRLVGLQRVGIALLAAILVCVPYFLHNLRVFGSLFHSDVLSVIGFLPYVDTTSFTHSLERPPSFPVWALGHTREILAHSFGGLRTMVLHILPGYLLGQRIWFLPFAVGMIYAIRGYRRWGFAILFGAMTLAAILPLDWLPRYLTMLVPFTAGLTALGLFVFLKLLEGVRPLVRRGVLCLLALLCVGLLAHQIDRTRRGVSHSSTSELGAARAYGPWLSARLAPGEAVMVETTSYWAWYSDRPAVYLVISDEAGFIEVVRRHNVRWAALPTSRLEDYSERFPEGRLPPLLEPVLEDAELDVTIFRVHAGDQ